MEKLIEVKAINIEREMQKTSDVAMLCDKAAELVISNQAEYETAVDILQRIKGRAKEIDTERKTITTPLDVAKKAVMDLFRKPLDLLEKTEKSLKDAIAVYSTEQERKAEAERVRLQKLAEKEAAEEKKRLDAKIARAEASGKSEKVEELIEQKANIIPINVGTVAPNIEQPKGVSFRDKYVVDVIDFSKVPDEYKLINQSALDKVAQATKGKIVIPGTQIRVEKIVASASARG